MAIATPTRCSSRLEPPVSVVSPVTLRRRRVVVAMVTAAASSVVAGLATGSALAWAALGATLAALLAYQVGLRRTSLSSFECQLRQLRDPSKADLDELLAGGYLRDSSSPSAETDQPARAGWLAEARSLFGFAAAYLLGWALSPAVFLLTLLVGKTPKDSTGQRWLANLQALQDKLREKSFQTAVLSAAATASVAATGVAMASPAVASASPAISASQAAAAPSATSAPTGSYTVVLGDTLSAIAARFDTTVAALAELNHLADPNLIFAGQTLSLPGGAPSQGSVELTSFESPSQPPGGPPESSSAAVAVRVALAQVGKPYVWAGAGPNDFDCSGLVMYAWEAAGVALTHYSVAQYDETTRISESQLEPGDLVFYDTGGGAQPGHVAMYVGNGQIVTADEPGTDVRVEPISWNGTPMGFGRVN